MNTDYGSDSDDNMELVRLLTADGDLGDVSESVGTTNVKVEQHFMDFGLIRESVVT